MSEETKGYVIQVVGTVIMAASMLALVLWAGSMATSYSAFGVYSSPEEQAAAQANYERIERERAERLAAARPVSKVIHWMGGGERVEILTDHKWGCQYIHTGDDRSQPLPRYRTDGTHDCDPARID